MKKTKKKDNKKEEEISIKPSYKHRVPHRPTRVHRNRKKYTRKGKTKNVRRRELATEEEE